MVTTSIAERAPSGATKETYEYSDWEEIKEMLSWASELCDRDDLAGSIPILRAVIHECHRFLVRFPDPSLFFSRPLPQGLRRERSSSPDFVLVSEERPWHDPTISRRSVTPESDLSHSRQPHHHPIESPSALHAVLGVALFLFGNIIAQNPSLALPREPTTPSPYWLAALDVFNAGDSLPCQTDGTHVYPYNAPGTADISADDWRVAIAWGRTLVALAHEATKRSSSPSPPPSPATARAWLPPASAHASPHSPTSSSPPPRYQPRSPIAAITMLRTPGLIHATRASAPELLTLAADQFSRGIFHMPHNNSQPHNNSTDTLSPPPSSSPSSSGAAARRPHVLFSIASEVLGVAERLGDAEARRRWAKWADEVFLQMHMEADVDAWRARVGVARGRCWLVVGSARVDEMEDKLERGDGSVLLSKEAEDARAGLSTSISFFDRAKRSASTESSEPSLENMQPWFAEALLSLANLTADEEAREALYARAQVEGDDAVARELSPRPTRTPRLRPRTIDVRMDES
ncbi:hypothetical protein DFH94DRAFT_637821 [Russula ochroleuca]|uniref:Uncharacterized protein n=1 Tax=Russula ochroleuca TaxID=152965 RepID=A0A9P5JY26_9AGAM|nr:hypothetical protein DFH94DRAFT_637821 [Russula ochroleuca]